MQPGERDRTVEERCERHADAGQRSEQQLDIYGNGCVGVELESVVWFDGAQSGARVGAGQDRVPELPGGNSIIAGPDHSSGPEDHLPDPGLQWMVERLLCDMGAVASVTSHLSYSQLHQSENP